MTIELVAEADRSAVIATQKPELDRSLATKTESSETVALYTDLRSSSLIGVRRPPDAMLDYPPDRARAIASR